MVIVAPTNLRQETWHESEANLNTVKLSTLYANWQKLFILKENRQKEMLKYSYLKFFSQYIIASKHHPHPKKFYYWQ